MKRISMFAAMFFALVISISTLPAEMFQVESEDGVQIVGNYTPAQKGKPTVVLVHELGKSGEAFSDFAPKLLGKGFGVVVFDQRGAGASNRTKTGGYLDQTHMDNNGQAKMMESDLGKVISQYKNATGAKDGEICILGAGVGANVAVNYAAHNPGLGGLVLLSMSKNRSGVTVGEPMDTLAANKQNMLMVYSSKESNRVENTTRESYRNVADVEAKPKKSESTDQPVGMIRQYGIGSGSDLLNGKSDDKIVAWIDKYGSIEKSGKDDKSAEAPEAVVVPPATEATAAEAATGGAATAQEAVQAKIVEGSGDAQAAKVIEGAEAGEPNQAGTEDLKKDAEAKAAETKAAEAAKN